MVFLVTFIMEGKLMEKRQLLNFKQWRLTKKVVFGFFLLFIVVGISFATTNYSSSNQYNGRLTGLLDKGSGSMLVVYDPNQNTVKEITSMPDVSPDNYGAVNSNGTYIAFTQWSEDKKPIRYLTVQSLSPIVSSKKDFMKYEEGRREVKSLSWLPDGKHLLFVQNDMSTKFPNQEINIMDVKTGNVKVIAKGGVWDTREILDIKDGKKIVKDYITQEQLDQIVTKYGGEKIPLSEAGRKISVEFSTPEISPDGQKIVYSATLFRNYALEPGKLWIATGIWIYDIKKGEARRVFSLTDESAIGRVAWSSDSKHLAFVRYRGMNGEDGQIDYLNLSDNNIKTIVSTTEEYFINLSPVGLENNEISFVSYPKEGEPKRFIVNPETGKIRLQKNPLNGINKLFRNFIILR